MDTERPPSANDFLSRLRDWFDAVLQIPVQERAAWMQTHVDDPEERAALVRLLESDAHTSGFFETPAGGRVDELALGLSDDLISTDGLIGARIGAFRIVRLLGKGGMAAVFLGEREGDDFRQSAAIKLLRRGLYSELEQRLFQRERRVLAGLTHPNIAHLIDGGLTDAGIPFLIMEYVDGLPVTRHAEQCGLGVRERVELFVTICRTVEAAHRSLVVHRDIKPSNILVTREGTVKLLDFGIAKLIDDDGEAPTVAVFTREYAAPEQIAGIPVTTATDVYALGILLYELLLGIRPDSSPTRRPSSQAGSATAAAAAPAHSLRRLLRGDLDNILLRALEVEPERRYTSAGALADDAQRYLAGRPIEAHPPSQWYRARKFVQRNRGGVAITAALVLGMFSALAMALWQANIAVHQEQAARREAQRANTVRDFIEKLFQPVSEGVAEHKQPTLSDLVTAGVQRLQSTPDLGNAERVDLTMMFARLHANLGERERAAQLADAADDLAKSTLDPLHPKAIDALALRGTRRVRDGNHMVGEPLLREAKRRLDVTGIRGSALIAVLDNLSVIEMDRDRVEEALALTRQALDERRRSYGEDAKEIAGGYNNLGYGLIGSGRFDEAADAFRRAYEIDIKYREPESYDVLIGLSNWGWALARAGRMRDARTRLAQTDDALQKLGGKPRGLHVVNSQKLCIVDLQFFAPHLAEKSCARMLEVTAAAAAKDDETYADSLRFEAARHIEIGELARADALLDQAWAIYPDTAQYARERGNTLALRAELNWLRGDATAARVAALAARAPLERQIDSPMTVLRVHGVLLLACLRAPAAECAGDLADQLQTDLQPYATSNDPRLLSPRLSIARALIERGAANQADRAIEQAIERARVELGDDHPLIATARMWRALALDHQNACVDAIAQRDAAEAAGVGRSSYPWLVEARAAFQQSARCRRDP